MQEPPQTRQEYDAFTLGYEASTGRKAPLQLPSPQSRAPKDAFALDQERQLEALAVPTMARRCGPWLRGCQLWTAADLEAARLTVNGRAKHTRCRSQLPDS